MTPQRIMQIAESPETPSFMFGSPELDAWTRQHRNLHTGQCVNSSGYYVVIHPSLDIARKESFRVLSCWNYGYSVPHSWDLDETVGFGDDENIFTETLPGPVSARGWLSR